MSILDKLCISLKNSYPYTVDDIDRLAWDMFSQSMTYLAFSATYAGLTNPGKLHSYAPVIVFSSIAI